MRVAHTKLTIDLFYTEGFCLKHLSWNWSIATIKKDLVISVSIILKLRQAAQSISQLQRFTPKLCRLLYVDCFVFVNIVPWKKTSCLLFGLTTFLS
jgi:hypothetical protein